MAYDVAFALVWAEDGEPLDTTSEAYAFAICADCAAVAVGFQVMLIAGQADVIVPENLSAAANYNCLRCLTYALASQLALTLDGPLSNGGTSRLNALWVEIAEFGRNLQNVPLSEIQGRLNAFKEQIKEIIQSDPSATKGTGTSATPSTTATPSPGSTPGSGQTASPRTTAPASVPSGTTTAAPPPAAPVTGGAASESSTAQEAPTTEPSAAPTEIAPVTPTPAPTTTAG